MKPPEYAKRLKQILDKECKLAKKEQQLTKRSARCHIKMEHLMTTVRKTDTQEKEKPILLECNQKLDTFIQKETEEQNKLQDRIKSLNELAKENQTEMNRLLKQRHDAIVKDSRFQLLKHQHNILLNPRCLPNKLQGVARKCDNIMEWLPFSIEMAGGIPESVDEISSVIWKELSTIQNTHENVLGY